MSNKRYIETVSVMEDGARNGNGAYKTSENGAPNARENGMDSTLQSNPVALYS